MTNPTPLRERLHRHHHWLYTLLLPLYLIGFFIVERLIDGNHPYFVSYLPLDDRIPFCEWFVIFYVLWYPFLVGVGIYLACHEPPAFKRYMAYIGATFLSSLVLFVLFPNGQDLRPALDTLGRDNIATRLIAAIYTADTNTNVCPSIHVVGSLAAMFGILHSDRLCRVRWVRISGWTLTVLIAASTVLIKQHSVLDAIVGVAYAFAFYPLIYRSHRQKHCLVEDNA